MYPEHLLTDDEAIIREFHPHWRILIPAGLYAVVGLAAALGGWLALDGTAWTVVGVGVGGAMLAVLAIPPVVRWRFRLYVLTTERIIVRDGILSRGSTELPVENINHVSFNQTILERLLGYGDVLIESAGTTGQSRLTDIPDPEAFQSEIYRAREARSLHLQGHPATAPARPAATDPVERLRILADLHERGALSDAEFAAKKAKLLDEI